MSDQSQATEVIKLLREIRDHQAAMTAHQEAALALLREQASDTRTRVAESIKLQKVGIARQRQALLLGLPMILLCLALIGYLIWRFF